MHGCSMTQQDEFRIAPGDIRGSVEILKEGRMFMNTLPGGEIPCQDMGGLGFYFADTRFLNCLELRVNDYEPVFLSRTLRDSHFAQVEMTNKEFESNGQIVPLQTVHIRLLRLVRDGYYQRIRLINFNQCPLEFNLRIKLGADFADIFEVRGTHRLSKGKMLDTVISKRKATINYLGKDNIKRSADISFSPAPSRISENDSFVYADYKLELEPKKKYYIYLKVTPVINDEKTDDAPTPIDLGFTKSTKALIDEYKAWQNECIKISSDNERFDYMARVAITDIRALRTTYPGEGTIIEAGIPWYAAPFGRDSIITAWQTLMVNPQLAKETIRFMARHQGKQINSWRDEQPGKIMHEMRFGEMAKAGEIPHTPYYGSVDSTLWFIILLSEYISWTADWDFFTEMSAPLSMAVQWCANYGDMDGDGYIEYVCQSQKGLVNQGWKDSWDGVVDIDGQIPDGPIALVEVQGYYYKALTGAANLYESIGQGKIAFDLRNRAYLLKKKFLKDFWMDKEGFLAYALDGKKKTLKTIVSNPGHCLFTGILPDNMAKLVIERLTKPDMYSGWGIRTMSDEETAYNPMSYHNGSVWPHDNAIIGYGMRKAGAIPSLKLLMETLFEAAGFFDHLRLPELFCGFTRRGKVGPVKYPIACDPQAWAVGTVFLFLRAMLGIECYGTDIYVRDPHLPGFLQTLRLENIRAGNGVVGLEFTRKHDKTYCGVIETEGNVKVIFE